MKRFNIIMIAIFVTLSCHAESQSDNTLIRLSTEQFKQLNLPFSQAVQVNGILYLSGELGVKPGTLTLVGGGITPETKQALSNIKTTLEHFGSSLDKVIKCTLFLADIKEWPDVNKVYIEYFSDALPARSAVASSGLGLGARIEIECMALAFSSE